MGAALILPAQSVQHNAELQADVCIIGGGAAGLTIAIALEHSGLSVLLLEAGSLRYSAKAQVGLRGEVAADSTHPPPHMYRRRGLGGASAIWGGRCIPLDPIDLESRPWVPDSGWPIDWPELARYYPAALGICEAGQFAFTAAEALGPLAPLVIAGFDHPDIDTQPIERFSRPTHFGNALRNRIEQASSIRAIFDVEVLRLLAGDGSVTGLDAAGPGDRRFNVRARHYVLATGGLETPRLLMLSDPTRRGGLGNESGALGRYYMCHLEATLARLRFLPASRPHVLDFERTEDGVYVRRMLVLSAEAQRREGLLNIGFRLHHPLIADPSHRNGILSAMYLVKDAVLPEYCNKFAMIELSARQRLRRTPRFWLDHLANVGRDALGVGRFAQQWLQKRILASRKLPYVVVTSADGTYPFDVNAEQVPVADNRVTLGDARDQFGRPVVRVRWRATSQDTQSVLRSMQLVRRVFAQSQCVRLDFNDDELANAVAEATPVGGHHIGTARMSATPAGGVVDANCTVHGMPNLHVASAAVFPTSGRANPTLTVIALALRLADHLCRTA